MIGPSGAVKVMIATEPVDFRIQTARSMNCCPGPTPKMPNLKLWPENTAYGLFCGDAVNNDEARMARRLAVIARWISFRTRNDVGLRASSAILLDYDYDPLEEAKFN
jgi:hypothetical protein